MADYSILFRRSARKELEELPSSIASIILEAINSLAQIPRPSGC
jgi:mRNA-degrading endonuclease RelE of RelBE toxin-antitoxin system